LEKEYSQKQAKSLAYLLAGCFADGEMAGERNAKRRGGISARACSRSICTAASPMPKNAPGRWQHPDAKSDPRNDPYYDHYNCPNCGLHFAVEVAE
jgi:hypothetical protein